MTTKEQLISLAKKKEFTSELLSHTVWKYSYKEDLRYYLWICELQKWLRDVQKIDIIIDVSTFGETYSSFIPNFIRGDWRSGECNSYEQALEAGLLNALNSLTEDNYDGMIDWRETQY